MRHPHQLRLGPALARPRFGARVLARAGFLAFAWLGLLVWAAPAHANDVPREAQDAFVELQRGNAQGALGASRRAVQLHEMSAGAWRVRGFVLSKAGNPQGALGAYAKAIQLDPRDAISHNNLGTLLLAAGDLEEALRSFEAAIRIDARYADALNNRGAVLERMKRAREAEASYSAATRAAPNHATAHNNLGAARLKRGDRQGAAQAFRRSAALDPRFDAPALNLAMLSDPSLADETVYQRLIAAAARPGASREVRVRALGAQAGRAADARNWQEARRLYLAALELSPRDVDLLNNVAVTEDQLELDRNAMLHLGEALRLRPDFDVARNNLGIVHVHRGDPARAKALFQDIIRRNPRFHRAHYNLGVILASEGKLAQARERFLAAGRLAPGDGAVRYNLGLLARESGAGLAAEKKAYEDALARDPELTEAHLALGGLLADPETPPRLRNYDYARRHLLKFLELAPSGDDAGRAQARQWLEYLAQRMGE